MSFDWSEYQHINYGQAGSGPALDRALALSRYNEAAKKGAPATAAEMPAVLYPQIHVLSGNKPTRNKTRYPDEAHKGSRAQRTGQHSFTRPYPIPIIRDHQAAPSECGGEASPVYGRMIDAKLVKNVESGASHVAGLAEIPHPDAIFEIMTGLWLTGSLGSSVHLAQCSICGESFLSSGAMADHPHQRGAHYRPEKPAKSGRPAPPPPDPAGAVGEGGDYVQCDPKERGALECLTDIMSYSAREYSRVVVPSDDESVIDVIDTSQSASHFTTAPAAEAEDLPRSALWVPMSASSRANVGAWGERYIDLVSGQERPASDLGLLFGHQLHEHCERLLSDEDAFVAMESVQISRQAHVPYSFSGLTVESAEEPAPAADPPTWQYGDRNSVRAFVRGAASRHVTAPAPAADESHEDEPRTEVQDESKLSTDRRDKMKGGTFCGPGRSFPVNDKAHYSAALRMVGRYKGPGNKARIRACILAKGKANGWDK